jgi:hypothetical protein
MHLVCHVLSMGIHQLMCACLALLAFWSSFNVATSKEGLLQGLTTTLLLHFQRHMTCVSPGLFTFSNRVNIAQRAHTDCKRSQSTQATGLQSQVDRSLAELHSMHVTRLWGGGAMQHP